MGYQIEFRHFMYFLAVAEELHFKRAADKLFISQPGLSRQIKRMETELNLQLFERHNRKVRLTEAGSYLQKELTYFFGHLEDIINHSKLLHNGIEGNLKLGYVGSAIQKIIPELLLKFRDTHPNVLINLTEIENKKQIHALLNNEIDIGFVRMERVPKGLKLKPTLEETFSIVLPKNHKINKSNFKSLSQLKHEHFILFDSSYSESYYEKVMHIFDDAGFTPLVSHTTVNASSIYRLVENNFGVSVVPTSLKLGYDMKIKFIELSKIPQRTTLKIVWNVSNKNPILKRFLNIIEKE